MHVCVCVCVCAEVVCGEYPPTHPKWTGGKAADELRRASVTDHDCTCSPEGAHSVCLCVHAECYGVFNLLAYCYLAQLIHATPSPHIVSQS